MPAARCSRENQHPHILVPILAFAAMAFSLGRGVGFLLFPAGVAIFLAAFATLAVSFLSFSMPTDAAAAPESSLGFLF